MRCSIFLPAAEIPRRQTESEGVTYIAFVGAGSTPSDIEDQAETKQLGEKLASELVSKNP